MIAIEGLSKSFRSYHKKTDRLKEWLLFGKKTFHEKTDVLKGINLHIPSGESFGIIGMNGAGKSTLLKIITGTMTASAGKVSFQGKVAALLELGTGFHPELTGRENVRINGRIHGLKDEDIDARIEDIAAFSELGPYFDKPVRVYSSGMYVRLAFSLASAVEPDILIIDEALSVGDAYFQNKCLKRIKAFKEKGVTILFVSHDASAIKLLCDRVALLKNGEIAGIGSAVDMLELYNALLAEKEETAGKSYSIQRGERDALSEDEAKGLRSGNYKARITAVQVLDLQKKPAHAIEAGQECFIKIQVNFSARVDNPTIGILIRDRLGYDIFGTNSHDLFQQTGTFEQNETGCFLFKCKMNLGPGDYTLTVAIHSHKTHIDECYEWVDRILTFKVLPRSQMNFLGVSFLEPEFSVTSQ